MINMAKESTRIKHRNEKRGARIRSRKARAFERRHHRAIGLHEARRERSKATGSRYNERHKHIGFTSLVRRIEAEATASHSHHIRGTISAIERERHVSRKQAIHIYAVGAAGHVWGRQHGG